MRIKHVFKGFKATHKVNRPARQGYVVTIALQESNPVRFSKLARCIGYSRPIQIYTPHSLKSARPDSECPVARAARNIKRGDSLTTIFNGKGISRQVRLHYYAWRGKWYGANPGKLRKLF